MTMRGLFLFLSLFLVGVLAQDDFFTRIPSCAVGFFPLSSSNVGVD